MIGRCPICDDQIDTMNEFKEHMALDHELTPPFPRMMGMKPSPWRRLADWWSGLAVSRQAVLATVAGVVIVGIVVLGAVADNRGWVDASDPISEQNCVQLARTYRSISSKIEKANAEQDPADRRRHLRWSMEDAQMLNQRVDALGGCPTEPSLR